MSMQDLAFPRATAAQPTQRAERLSIFLPWPSSSLMPNQKNGRHWAAYQAAKAKARADGEFLARPHRGSVIDIRTPVRILFAAPDRRVRDLDNLLAACKPLLDGVAKGLGIDDKQFRPITLDSTLDQARKGYVLLEIGA